VFPKNSNIWVTAITIGRSETIWGKNALKFDPERFINSDHKPFEYIPFSAGKTIGLCNKCQINGN